MKPSDGFSKSVPRIEAKAGTYALIGACAMLAGTARITISLVGAWVFRGDEKSCFCLRFVWGGKWWLCVLVGIS